MDYMKCRLIYEFFLFTLILGVIVISGCTTPESSPSTLPTTLPSINPTISSQIPTENVTQVSTPATIDTQIENSPPLSSNDINLHFMEIAFPSGNIYLLRASPGLLDISIQGGNPNDKQIIEEFAKEFNELSQKSGVELFENTKEGNTGHVRVHFIPGNGMDAIDLTSGSIWINKEYKSNGITYAKISGQDIYINSDLQGIERKHYILRSLLFSLGLKGDTTEYPDSIFYYAKNNSTKLSAIDERAIQVMYSPGLYTGMTVEDVKKVIFIK